MKHYGGAPTMRCVICATNWPYAEQFRVCPDCETECRPVRLQSEDEEVLTWQEAVERARAAENEGSDPAPRKGRLPTAAEIRQLRAGLDFWAHAEGPNDPRLR